MSVHVTVDARMLGVTGIGTYIRHVVPRVIELWPEARFTLMGEPDALDTFVSSERVRVRPFRVPIYSVQEQLVFSRITPPGTNLFWSPHYNIPLSHRGRLAVMVHDVIHLALPTQSIAQRMYARGMFAQVRRRASVVLTNSQFTASDFRTRVGEPNALVVAPLGVDGRWFGLERPPTERTPYFLFVGNVKPHKNLPRLLQAFALVAGRIPHRLLLAGPREGLRTLDHAAASAATALGDRVSFTGRLTQSALEQYVASCDALLLPSLYEGFGLPPLEALAAGRPVGVSHASALPEVCGPEAEYFDPLDVNDIAACLLRLASRPHDLPADVARRRAWAARFGWAECARLTHEALVRASDPQPTHVGARRG